MEDYDVYYADGNHKIYSAENIFILVDWLEEEKIEYCEPEIIKIEKRLDK